MYLLFIYHFPSYNVVILKDLKNNIGLSFSAYFY